MTAHPIDGLVLTTIFVNSADVAAVRGALLLPPDLGENEAAFVRCTSRILESLGKIAPSIETNSAVARFKTGWVDQFNHDLEDLRRVLSKVKAGLRADAARLLSSETPP